MEREYLLLLPIEPFSIGDTFESGAQLPLHCTVMYWFKPGWGNMLEAITESLKAVALINLADIKLISTMPARLGPKRDISVHLFERDPPLLYLHTAVLLLLAKMNSLPRDLKLAGAGYVPHVTSTDRAFPPGSECFPRELVLIERGEDGAKKVSARFPLFRT
ncbi:MAG TPA: hypothetical protein VGB97_01475 [Candidatus Paceibacterota bacterium]|jgi:hypothetical protein